MKRVGIVGWRGMVGSVLVDRMLAEGDFAHFQPTFFSTSQAGQTVPDMGQWVADQAKNETLQDANDINSLGQMDIIVTCQGGDYTKAVHSDLRNSGWKGYWIDAASSLRMDDQAVIVLDPVNRRVIDRAINAGIRDFIGGNCTVSLMLMALEGLFREGWVQWMSTMTYQSASGGGAKHMAELVAQMGLLGSCQTAGESALQLERKVTQMQNSSDFPTDQFGVALGGNLIPWIDRAMDNGQTREEWKGESETNKILQTPSRIPIDGQCVRVGAMRCHSQAITLKLNQAIPLKDIQSTIANANAWVKVVPNEKEATLQQLTPASVSGKLEVPVGRIRKMTMGDDFLTCFTVGDQLLWGAAEPLRRMLLILLGKLS